MSGQPCRVAFLLPHFRAGGAERVVLNWIGALDRSRFTPLLFLTRIEGDFLAGLPGDVEPIALGGGRALRLPRRIAAALATHQIDVAYSATNAMNLALLAAPARRVARIVSEHTPPRAYLAEAKLPLLRRAAMRHFYPRAAAIAVPTERIAAEIADVIARPVNTVTLPNPVIATVAPTVDRAVTTAPAQLVSAGRLVPAKGFDTLIDACAILAANGTAFHLRIFGDGPLHAQLAQQIAAAALGDHVTLAGHSDRLADEIVAADLFVLASRREGFGNVIIEAMAGGTPVLATRSGGPEAIITDGENGFLVQSENPSAMATRIATLIGDPQHRRSVCPAATETARGYDITSSTRRFEALLSQHASWSTRS